MKDQIHWQPEEMSGEELRGYIKAARFWTKVLPWVGTALGIGALTNLENPSGLGGLFVGLTILAGLGYLSAENGLQRATARLADVDEDATAKP